MSHPETVVPEEVSAEEAAALETIAAEEELDEHYQIDMAVISGETMVEISLLEEVIDAKKRELEDFSQQLEVLNIKLLLKKEKLNGMNLVLSVIEKRGIEYFLKKTEYQETATLEDAQ